MLLQMAKFHCFKANSKFHCFKANSSVWSSQVALVVKNPPAKAADVRTAGYIPGWGRCPGGGHGNPLQSSCLKDPKNRGAWQAAVHASHRVGHD